MFDNLPQMGRRGAFLLNATILAVFLGASAVPTPVYPLYQSLWGFPPVMTTVIFAVYALVMLASLLFFGRLADHLGSRPVLLAAIGVEVVSMAFFMMAGSIAGLLVARALQGLATGAAMSATGAALMTLEHPQRKGSAFLVTALVAPLGLAFCATGASVMVDLLPAPTRLSYLIVAILLVILAALLLHTRSATARLPGAWSSMKPSINIPPQTRPTMAIGMPVAAALWALGGLYLSLGPALARQISGSDSPLFGGLALLCLYVPAALSIVLLRRLGNRSILMTASTALVCGVSAVMYGVLLGSMTAYFSGTVVAGVGFGAGYYVVMRTIVPLGLPHERTGLLSSIYIICYLAFSVPTVAAGLLVGVIGLRQTTLGYGAVLVAVCLSALLVLTRRTWRDRRLSAAVSLT